MILLERVKAFLVRNRGAVARKAIQQTAVRLWILLRLWRLFGPLLPAREPRTWVFMGGCYNSGTTILREMIGAHPEVASLPREGVEMTDAFPDLEAGGWTRMWYRNTEMIDGLLRDPLIAAKRAKRDWSVWWRQNTDVFIEKSIVHGAWMPALEAGFPDARFIGVVRNGYCVCEGIRRRARPRGGAQDILGSESYPIEEVGKQWIFANEVLLRDSAKLEKYHQVHYESFVSAPLHTIQEIFRFIGVDHTLVWRDSNGMIWIGSRSFDIKDQNPESLARLSNSDTQTLETMIGPLMKKMGYELLRSGNKWR